MLDFNTLFVFEKNISWDNFLFGGMLFLVILVFFIASIRSKNEGSILKIIMAFLMLLYLSFSFTFMYYKSNMRDYDVWERYKNGDYKTIIGKVEKYKVGYKNKKRYEYFVVKGIRFSSVYASPNPTKFNDKIFFYHPEILEENLTLRISYIENIESMINNAIVKFEIEDR